MGNSQSDDSKKPLIEMVTIITNIANATNDKNITLSQVMQQIDAIYNDPEKQPIIKKLLSASPKDQAEYSSTHFTTTFNSFQMNALEAACYLLVPELITKLINDIGFTPLTALTNNNPLNECRCCISFILEGAKVEKPVQRNGFTIWDHTKAVECLRILINKFPNEINHLCNSAPELELSANPLVYISAFGPENHPERSHALFVELLANGADPFQERFEIPDTNQSEADLRKLPPHDHTSPWTAAVDQNNKLILGELISLESQYPEKFRRSLNHRYITQLFSFKRPLDLAASKPNIRNLLLSAPGIDKSPNTRCRYPLQQIAEFLRRADTPKGVDQEGKNVFDMDKFIWELNDDDDVTVPSAATSNPSNNSTGSKRPPRTVESAITELTDFIAMHRDAIKLHLSDTEKYVDCISDLTPQRIYKDERAIDTPFLRKTALEWSCVVGIPQITQLLLNIGMKPRLEQFASERWGFDDVAFNSYGHDSDFILTSVIEEDFQTGEKKSVLKPFECRNRKNYLECVRLICKHCPEEMKKICNDTDYESLNKKNRGRGNGLWNNDPSLFPFLFPPLTFLTKWQDAYTDTVELFCNELFNILIDEGGADPFADEYLKVTDTSEAHESSLVYRIVNEACVEMLRKVIACRSKTSDRTFFKAIEAGTHTDRKRKPIDACSSGPSGMKMREMIQALYK